MDTEGGLVVRNSTGQTRLPINALPDARILTDEKGRLLLLTDATQRYRHGVLGDSIEAASITMVETEPEVRVVLKIPIPDDTVVEFYRLEGDELRIIAQVSGFTSHVFGSRNLDMAVAGDFDGDGRTELLLPDQTRTELGAIRHTSEGAEVAWTVDLDERLQTNIMAVALSDGGMVVGVGMAKGTLRLWVP